MAGVHGGDFVERAWGVLPSDDPRPLHNSTARRPALLKRASNPNCSTETKGYKKALLFLAPNRADPIVCE